MNKELLEQIGLWLYGSQWRPELARALNVKIESVKRWANGDYNISNSITSDILDLVKAKTDAAPDLINQLEGILSEATPCD